MDVRYIQLLLLVHKLICERRNIDLVDKELMGGNINTTIWPGRRKKWVLWQRHLNVACSSVRLAWCVHDIMFHWRVCNVFFRDLLGLFCKFMLGKYSTSSDSFSDQSMNSLIRSVEWTNQFMYPLAGTTYLTLLFLIPPPLCSCSAGVGRTGKGINFYIFYPNERKSIRA